MALLWRLIGVCALLVAGGVCASEWYSAPLNPRIVVIEDPDNESPETTIPDFEETVTISEDGGQPESSDAPTATIAVVEEADTESPETTTPDFEEDETENHTVTISEDGAQPESTDAPTATIAVVEEPESIETTMLEWIAFGANVGSNSSITLSRREFNEECFLVRDGKTVKLEEVDIEGVKVFTDRTPFVSCRVVIGPMSEELIGQWTLCGRREEGGMIRERCQPTLTFWAQGNPNDDFTWRTLNHFDHPVHFGGRVNPLVRNSGILNTCHVVTPFGEDIVVTANADYPGLSLVSNLRDRTVCSIFIGEVNRDFLGTWTLYGTYNSTVGMHTVVVQPMTFFLYDEQNPYSQAYNTTNLERSINIVNEGNTIQVDVTGSGTRVECVIETNKGQRFTNANIGNLPGVSFVSGNSAQCRFQIGPITEDMFGEWVLRGRYRRSVQLNNEILLPFTLVLEDPENPIHDETREIEYLSGEDIYTWFGTSHSISTAAGRYQTTDSCHLRTPNGLQFVLRDGFTLPGVSFEVRSGIACGVRVEVENEDVIGNWMLIARVNTRNGGRIEQRLPFTIHVEDYIAALPNATTIAEGNDLILRLESPATMPNSCALEGPTRSTGDVVPDYARYCGFVVREVTMADSGRWNITYGDRVKFKAFVDVTVIQRNSLVEHKIQWVKDDRVNQTIGPEDTIFCRVENPRGLTIFEGFGRCNIILDRVTSQHQGTWRMIVGTEGRVLTETHEFIVEIEEAEPKAEVITSVQTEKPNVMLSCHVPTEAPVTACKFRDPSGRVLLASRGVGEDRYTFHGVGVSMRSSASDHQCGLRITNPVLSDLGLWRCAVETEVDTYYGFLTVLCPFAMQTPEVAAQVVSEATLAATSDVVKAVEGDDVIMRCSISSAIRYCYFRRQNGTVFSVSPGSSGDWQYVGAGLDAGECGIRFPSLLATDGGGWSCHVGFHNVTLPEQQARFEVTVEPLMRVEQYHVENPQRTLVVSAQMHSSRALDYCRFVRMDGLGFTSANLPEGYSHHGDLNTGRCEIRIDYPSVLEQHPWSIAARIQGQAVEISRSTDHSLDMPGPEPGPRPQHRTNFLVVWTAVLTISLLVFFFGVVIGPKRNREWTYRRASALRDSFRRSFRKGPILPEGGVVPHAQNTPMAA